MVHLAGLHTVVRVSAASSQLILLQIGPRRCLQRLRAAPFWFVQLLFCVGGIVTFVILDRRSRFFTQAWLKAVFRFSELNARLRAEVGHDTDRKLGRLSPRRIVLRHVSLSAAM